MRLNVVSEFRDYQKGIVTDRECGTVELCRNLEDGTQFNAEYDPKPDFDLQTELGNDPREVAKIAISDQTVALKLRSNQRIAILLFGQWQPFKVVRRSNNPGNPQAEFTLQYLPPGDQN